MMVIGSSLPIAIQSTGFDDEKNVYPLWPIQLDDAVRRV